MFRFIPADHSWMSLASFASSHIKVFGQRRMRQGMKIFVHLEISGSGPIRHVGARAAEVI